MRAWLLEALPVETMVKAGEISGQMDVILNRLADYQESSEELAREIKSAMTYPVISMVLVLKLPETKGMDLVRAPKARASATPPSQPAG